MRSANRTFRDLFLYIILSVALIFLDSRGTFSPLRQAFQALTIPIKNSLYQTKQSFGAPFAFIARDVEEGRTLVRLEEEIASLSAQVMRTKALEEENENLRRLLGAPLPNLWKFIPARVVTREEDVIIVSGTPGQGEGTPVIVPASGNEQNIATGGILIGKVRQVLGRETKVILPTHPGSRIPVFTRRAITGARQASGILIGDKGSAILDQVLTGESLQSGDFVITSGGAGLPPDLLIGTVEEVLGPGSRAWQRASVKMALEEIPEYVFLISEY